MSVAGSRLLLGKLARLGTEILGSQVLPNLGPQENGKYVAVDVETGDFELDADDYSAVTRLRSRRPFAVIWLGFVGQATTYLMRSMR